MASDQFLELISSFVNSYMPIRRLVIVEEILSSINIVVSEVSTATM